MIINQCSERCERLLPMWTFVETLQRRSSDAADMVVQMYTANRMQLSQLVRPRTDGACRPRRASGR